MSSYLLLLGKLHLIVPSYDWTCLYFSMIVYGSVIFAVNFGQVSSMLNISTTMETVTREIFTGRWEVFNDPLLDPKLIPDDPDQREGLRVMLLCSTLYSTVISGYDVISMKIDYHRLMEYYYKEYNNTGGYITLCYGAMRGTNKYFSCVNITKAEIDAHDDYGTFNWVLENLRTAFISDIIMMPLIFLIGIFGKYSQYLLSYFFFKTFFEIF